MQFRFSIRAVFETVTVLALVLALGKFAEVASNSEGIRYWWLIVVAGAAAGAYLGFRWFRRIELGSCGLFSLVLGFLLTAIGLLPIIATDLLSVPRPGWLRRWEPMAETKVIIVLSAAGGMLAAVAVLIPAATSKYLELKRAGEWKW